MPLSTSRHSTQTPSPKGGVGAAKRGQDIVVRVAVIPATEPQTTLGSWLTAGSAGCMMGGSNLQNEPS